MTDLTVLTIGTFDLFHFGHVRLLKRCRDLAGPDGIVIAGLNPDAFIAQFKHRYPVITYHERREVLEACRYVDVVLENVGGHDARPIIERAQPDLIAVGDDWAPPKDYLGQLGITEAWLIDRGIKVVYLPRTDGVASSSIRTLL